MGIRTVLSTLTAAHGIGLAHGGIRLNRLFLHQRPTEPPVLKVLGFGRVSATKDAESRVSVLPRPSVGATVFRESNGVRQFACLQTPAVQRVHDRQQPL
jgi:hypothetical protein